MDFFIKIGLTQSYFGTKKIIERLNYRNRKKRFLIWVQIRLNRSNINSMIKFSKKVEYALIALVYMAQKPGRELTTARELSNEYNISLELMGKILQSLVRSGLVISVQGVKGGYYIGPSIDHIKIISVISAIDGQIAIANCMNNEQQTVCKRERNCPIRKSMEDIQSRLVNLLDEITLKDFQKP